MLWADCRLLSFIIDKEVTMSAPKETPRWTEGVRAENLTAEDTTKGVLHDPEWLDLNLRALRPELTKQTFDQAREQFCQWYPEHEAILREEGDTIFDHMINGTRPDPDSRLGRTLGGPKRVYSTAELSFSPCQWALAQAGVSVACFVVSLVGLPAKRTAQLDEAFIRRIEGPVFNGWQRAMQDFDLATGAVQKATKLAVLLNGIATAGGLKIVLDYVQDGMSYYDWIVGGLTMAGQILTWAATEFIAFIAEAALTILSAVNLGVDIGHAVNTCKT